MSEKKNINMTIDNPIQTLDELIYKINHDTYILTRNDIDSIEWRLREVQKYIKEIYNKKGKNF